LKDPLVLFRSMISRLSLVPQSLTFGGARRLLCFRNGSKCATLGAAAVLWAALTFSAGCSRTPPPLTHTDPVPAEINSALNSFRAEGARGWSFTQTTQTDKEKLVEHYDPSKPDNARWVLLQKDGHAPTEADLKDYNDKLSRRGGGDTAPDVVKQIDRNAATRVSDDAQKSVYSFRLKPGGKDDASAAFMSATFTYDKAAHAFEKVEIANIEPFAPMFAVKIKEAHTSVYYQLPTGDRPTLLDHITVKIRGRALIIRSLDEDMTVSYSDYKYTGQHFATKIQPDAP
jgi:hypothetical protein